MARRFAKMARRAGRQGGPDATVFVLDYNAEMIAAGVERGLPEMCWAVGDAQRLPLPDATADAYVISFGIRNVTDIPAPCARPAGCSSPAVGSVPGVLAAGQRGDPRGLRRLFLQGDPEIGARVANDRERYQYLVESIRRFPDQKTFAR